jgi:hypothetical protein
MSPQLIIDLRLVLGRANEISGDGRADYLCIAVDGSATGYLNIADANQPSGVGFTFVGQVKHDEGKDRANIRFYDVTGDVRTPFNRFCAA